MAWLQKGRGGWIGKVSASSPASSMGRVAAKGGLEEGGFPVSWLAFIHSSGSLQFSVLRPSPELREVTPTVPNLPLIATQRLRK